MAVSAIFEFEARGWRMPGVAALPQPDVKDRGWELYGGDMDAQMRNAIYGYLAEPEKQTKAAYMREVVLPGMAHSSAQEKNHRILTHVLHSFFTQPDPVYRG